MKIKGLMAALAAATLLAGSPLLAQEILPPSRSLEGLASGLPESAIELEYGLGAGLDSQASDSTLITPFSVARFPRVFRTIDGRHNNSSNPLWGSAGTPLLRLTTVDYEDGTDSPSGQLRASARELSNVCAAQHSSLPNRYGATDYLWQWGQFLDHDMDLAPGMSPPEPFNVDVPLFDPQFDPQGTGVQLIGLNRTRYVHVNGVRQQVNVITSFIDASNVYGSDAARAQELRQLDGSGRLKLSAGRLLPFNVNGFPNDPTDHDPFLYLAGDTRVNEQIGLTAMHTLFAREHNWWTNRFKQRYPFLNGDAIYQLARAMVGAEIQAITYREFLPLLLGPDALPPYAGYDPTVDPSVSNAFATAAYRVGHTMLSSTLQRLGPDLQPIPAGNIALQDAFFNPAVFAASGLEPILRGLASQPAQEIDNFVIDDVRNFLFGAPGAGGFDLASLNIQRGRDHGLPSFNQARMDFGLPAHASFADVNPDPEVQAALAEAYATVDDIDLWVGGLAEPHVPGAMVGETFHAILTDQFTRLRDGDRFFYESYLPEPFLGMAKFSTLSRIIKRNTSIGDELQSDVFRMP